MAVAKTLSLLLKTIIWAFSDGLVLKIPGAHCCGPGSISAQGSEIPKAMQQGEKKKIPKQTNKNNIFIFQPQSTILIPGQGRNLS